MEAVAAPVESQSSWLPSFPHSLTAAMANFMFGYHIGYCGLLCDSEILGLFAREFFHLVYFYNKLAFGQLKRRRH